MKAPFDFVIEPKGSRYNNTKKVGDKELIINTEIFNHQYVNRKAKVLATPILVETNIQVGDIVIVHHNIFRRWHNAHGKEQNSSSYISNDKYAVRDDQIFLFKNKNTWQAPLNYCFVKPIKSYDKFSVDAEQPLIGIMKYTNKNLLDIKVNDLVGFTPGSEYEFIINGERLYRVMNKFITIKYEYQGNEEAYNPSWA